MKKYFEIIKYSKLFNNIKEDELDSMLNCLQAEVINCPKESYVIKEGERITNVYLVLKGKIHIVKEDYWGNQNIMANIACGQIFGESFACSKERIMGASALAKEDSQLLALNVHRIFTTCSSSCKHHSVLIENMVGVLAQKNMYLSSKIEYMSRRTTRDKLIAYLSDMAKQSHVDNFIIPFNRQQLADYLCVDRSAMSAELSKMKKEGIVDFNKENFTLLSSIINSQYMNL